MHSVVNKFIMLVLKQINDYSLLPIPILVNAVSWWWKWLTKVQQNQAEKGCIYNVSIKTSPINILFTRLSK